MGDIRDRLRAAIATIEQFADGKFELHLRPPATEAKLQEAEREFGHRLPGDLRELYLLHDGQAQLLSTASLFLGEPFASLDRALAVWRHMVNFHGLEQGKPPIEQPWPAAAPELRSVEHDILWFPFAVLEDEMKTAYWVDLNPVEGRPLGQVIEEGPWAHPPQYVGWSVLELLETIAEYAGSDQMTTLPTYGFVSWGFGPNHSGFTWANPYLRGPQNFPSFVDDLPPEWSRYLRAKSPLYANLFGHDARATNPTVRADAPLPEDRLAKVDMVARPPHSIDQLGDISDLRLMVVTGAESIHGIEAAPLQALVIKDSPRLSFRGFEGSTATLDIVGEVAIPDVDLPKVSIVQAPIRSRQGWAFLDRFSGISQAALTLSVGVDPNDHDWSSATSLAHLDLRGGSLRSLEFLAQLPQLKHLRLLAPADISIAGLSARDAGLSLIVVDAPLPGDIAELAALDVPTLLAAPIEWYRAMEGRMQPGVWTMVSEGGDASAWADLTALNWRERRTVMSARGLDKS